MALLLSESESLSWALSGPLGSVWGILATVVVFQVEEEEVKARLPVGVVVSELPVVSVACLN